MVNSGRWLPKGRWAKWRWRARRTGGAAGVRRSGGGGCGLRRQCKGSRVRENRGTGVQSTEARERRLRRRPARVRGLAGLRCWWKKEGCGGCGGGLGRRRR